MVGFGIAIIIKATQSDKSVIPSVCEKMERKIVVFVHHKEIGYNQIKVI